MIDCVFRIEYIGQDMKGSRLTRVWGPTATKLRESSGNVLLYTGTGTLASEGFPVSTAWFLANGFDQVLEGTAALNYWNTSQADWIAAHPWLTDTP